MQKFYSVLVSVTTFTMLLFSNVCFGQTLEFGTLDSFEAFAGVGAVTNSGTAAGDAGTNAGIISGTGFDPANGYTGTTHNSSSLTVQARIDLLRVYIHLDDVFVTNPSTHLPAFGSGETISPGVYSIAGAGSLAGAVTLDGGGDEDAVFIMKFEGAFTVGASAEVILAGGTRAANVFWISQGAISVATTCVIKGSLFAHPGAVTLGVGSTIEGRLLTSEGAITIEAGGVADMPVGPSTIPINCIGDCSSAPTVDVLGSLKDFAFFTSLGAVANAATSGIVGAIGTNGGAISGFLTSTHANGDATTGFVYNSDLVTAQAATDLDNAYAALMALPNTVSAHTPAFGSGETLTTGVYHIAGAGSLAGSITLDGGGDPNAIFVFKFAGAFSVAAQSRVILIGGARRCNIFWISGAGVATGATDLGTFTYMKGTLIAHGGACSAGANSSVEGRMLSTGGAIGFSTGIVYNDELCFGPPVNSIDAVEDLLGPINGNTGGNTTTLIANDLLDDNSAAIGTGLGQVIMTTVGVLPPGITVDLLTGIVTVAPGTPAGDYPITYQICEVDNPANCDSATSTIMVSSSDVALVKTASVSGTSTLGDIITYVFKVENTGTTTLTNVVVTDSMVGLTITGGPITSLAVGDSNDAITGTYTITQDDIDAGSVTNSALATAQDPYGIDVTDISGTTNDNDSITIVTLTQNPMIALVKTASVGGTGILGDVITYTFKVENTGNITLTNVVVTDPMVGLTITGGPIASLAVGDSSLAFTGAYTITQNDIDAGNVTNSALATAQDPDGNDITDISGTSNDNDTPTVITLNQNPAIALVKTAVVSGTGVLGDVITYILRSENTGNTTLTNVVITDPMVGLVMTGAPIASFAPEATSIAIATYTITQSDIDEGSVSNSATITGQDPEGNDVTDISGTTNYNDSITVVIIAPPLPDFTPTIDIDALSLVDAGSSKDFVLNISEIAGASSVGPVMVKIVKGDAFFIEFDAAAAQSNVNGVVSVDNVDWEISQNALFITMTLKPGSIIEANTFSAIGFTITRNSLVAPQTTQPITATIVDGSGLDSQNFNNSYNTTVIAQ